MVSVEPDLEIGNIPRNAEADVGLGTLDLFPKGINRHFDLGGVFTGDGDLLTPKFDRAITAGAIEFRGEQIPITRENAAKIKVAVNALRKQIERAESDVCLRVPGNITNLQIRFDAYHEDIRQLIQRAGSDEQESGSGLGPLITYSINKLNQLSGMLTVHPEWER